MLLVVACDLFWWSWSRFRILGTVPVHMRRQRRIRRVLCILGKWTLWGFWLFSYLRTYHQMGLSQIKKFHLLCGNYVAPFGCCLFFVYVFVRKSWLVKGRCGWGLFGTGCPIVRSSPAITSVTAYQLMVLSLETINYWVFSLGLFLFAELWMFRRFLPSF